MTTAIRDTASPAASRTAAPRRAPAWTRACAALVLAAAAPLAGAQAVANLPDFTGLVEQVGPAVVNIEAVTKAKPATAAPRQRGLPDDGEDGLPEIFKRFGFDFEAPGGPGGPRGGGTRGGRAAGSGFIISPDGYVMTNHHVVAGADTVKVKLSDRREFTAKVVGSDEQYDVALLKIETTGLPSVKLGNSDLLKPGQWVVAIGSPFGLDHSVTAGIVSAVGRSNPYAGQQYVPFIQTDVAINQGNSGGPLLNTRGEVVGINSQIFSNSGGYMGVSFAIPIDLAMSASEQLKKTGKVARGYLGVGIEAIDADSAEAFGLANTRGALVNQVTAGSAGDKAGLQVGDVITSVNGREITSQVDLPPVVGALAPGTRAKVAIVRDGKPRVLEAVLGNSDAMPGAGTGDDDEGPASPGPKASPAAAFGLSGVDLTAAERQRLGLKAGEGVKLASVTGGAAQEAGLRPGDVVLQVTRTPVGSAVALNQALRAAKPGQAVMLLVRRGQATTFVPLRPGE